MSTVFLRSGGAIFEEVYSDARWCRSMSKMGNKNLRFFPSARATLPEASSRLQGRLVESPLWIWRPQNRFLEQIITEQEGSARGPTSSTSP